LFAEQARRYHVQSWSALQVALIVIALDFVQSLFSYVLVSPFLALPSFQVSANWSLAVLPQWMEVNYGSFYRWSYFFGTALLGLVAVGTLQMVCSQWISHSTQWSRARAALHVFAFGLVPILVLPVFPRLVVTLSEAATQFFLPVLGFCFLLGVWLRMPLDSQKALFGRGLLSEAVFPIWSFLSKLMLPALLLFFAARWIKLF
jgi:hypothetical protein